MYQLAHGAAIGAADLLALVRDGDFAAVVVDPDLGQGWAVTTAEQIVSSVSGLVPVVLVCRHDHDAQVIQQRLAGPTVIAMLAEQLTAEQLAAAVAGAIAAHAERSRAIRPV